MIKNRLFIMFRNVSLLNKNLKRVYYIMILIKKKIIFVVAIIIA